MIDYRPCTCICYVLMALLHTYSLQKVAFDKSVAKSHLIVEIHNNIFGQRWGHQISNFVCMFKWWCRYMGRGLFAIPDYETWKPQRKLYDPSFKRRCSIWSCHNYATSVLLFIFNHTQLTERPPAQVQWVCRYFPGEVKTLCWWEERSTHEGGIPRGSLGCH